MTNSRAERPILVTGSHRSGTTWISRMLAMTPNVLLVDEPFNPDAWAYKLNGLAKWWFTYAPGLRHEDAIHAFDKVILRGTGKVYSRRVIQRYLPLSRKGRLIIKDPIACFSSDWLFENYNLQILVVLRHPGAFAASLKRMNWTFSFQNLLQQDQLMKDHLFPFRAEMKAEPQELIEQAALLWKVIYHVLIGFAAKHPDWIIVKHESLSLNPVAGFRDLYARLGLKWSPRAMQEIISHTSAQNPTEPPQGVAQTLKRNSAGNVGRWKSSLTKQEIQHVQRVTRPLADRFYDESTWC
jgi:sulfotransferase family protein